MGVLPARGLATTVLADPDFLWPIPARWSLEQAATIPVVYSTVSQLLLKLDITNCLSLIVLMEIHLFIRRSVQYYGLSSRPPDLNQRVNNYYFSYNLK